VARGAGEVEGEDRGHPPLLAGRLQVGVARPAVGAGGRGDEGGDQLDRVEQGAGACLDRRARVLRRNRDLVLVAQRGEGAVDLGVERQCGLGCRNRALGARRPGGGGCLLEPLHERAQDGDQVRQPRRQLVDAGVQRHPERGQHTALALGRVRPASARRAGPVAAT
jgi:hypothetical protein